MEDTNLALASAGASVTSATCADPRHPPAAVIDGSESTFWATTGLFPQEIVVTLPAGARLSQIKLLARAVRRVRVEVCDKHLPVAFQTATEADVAPGDEAKDHQFEVLQLGGVRARHVKIVLLAGHHDFCALHKVELEGTPE